MNSDLRGKVVGDYIFTIFHGWTQITKVVSGLNYPITTEGRYLYTLDGKHDIDAKYPSAFTEPPAEFNAEPKPCEFEKGQKVLVRDHANVPWRRRYFAGENPKQLQEKFGTFVDGADEWSSKGQVLYWKFCKPWVEGEDG
jgi:hypothetical protein